MPLVIVATIQTAEIKVPACNNMPFSNGQISVFVAFSAESECSFFIVSLDVRREKKWFIFTRVLEP